MATKPVQARSGRGARERIEQAAERLFYRNGINATGVDALCEAAAVSKRTLYQHFSSKTDVVENYLRLIDQHGGSVLERQLDAGEGEPRERLLAIFDAPATARFRGCPFHNAAVESAGAMPGVDEVVRAHKRHFQDRLTAVAADAGASDPEGLAAQLLVIFEGATALATTLNDDAPLHHARMAAATLLDASIRPASRGRRSPKGSG